MFTKKQKGQVSVEMLIILGVIILVAVVFVSYYLSVINKNIDKTSNVPTGVQVNNLIENSFNNPNLTSAPTSLATCGNGTIDPMEVCDYLIFPFGLTCDNITGAGTTLVCTDCLEITCT